jgi:hypothetical protein
VTEKPSDENPAYAKMGRSRPLFLTTVPSQLPFYATTTNVAHPRFDDISDAREVDSDGVASGGTWMVIQYVQHVVP